MFTVVRRKNKLDAVRTINDLVGNRNFEIIHPLQKVVTPTYSHTSNGRSLNNVTVWYAKLKAPDKEEE